MAVVVARDALSRGRKSEFCIELGIVNNMPDAALERTERQFFNLLGAAGADLLVRVSFFSLSSLERGPGGRAHLAKGEYRSAAELPGTELDAVIVTGAEPRAPDLRCEPYWSELASLFDWLKQDGPSALFSCLAAHAAVLHYDGIGRRRLAEKRFGEFEHVVAGHDMLTEHVRAPLKVAHSRWNEVSETALAECGYRILTWSRDAGVELFVRRGRTDLLFCQGHPEYDQATLAREYHRDVRRFLARETDTYPKIPHNYFTASEARTLAKFRMRALSERGDALMGEYPALARRADTRREPPAAPVFRAWLRQIVESKRLRHAHTREPVRRTFALARAS